MSVTISISPNLPGRHLIHYTLQLIADNKEVEFIYQSGNNNADIQISERGSEGLHLCVPFYQYLTSQDYRSVQALAQGSYFFFSASGQKDLLASIFYLVNCIQEYDTTDLDQYGRFPYKRSLQQRNAILRNNVVQKLIDEFCSSLRPLAALAVKRRRSRVFLTHDIDTVYGSRNENGKYALMHYQWMEIPRLLWNQHMGTPDWLNMDKIVAVEKSYGYRSAFYWLVHKDKKNADYELDEKRIQEQINKVEESGCDVGLHKSLRADSLSQELLLLKRKTDGQRYHFLSFNLPKAWKDLEEAGIRIDTSLGFSEDFGYRNSYGLPFMPYDVVGKRVYDLVEVPMQVMDRTFFNQKKQVKDAEKELTQWLEANKFDSVFTINFHNNFFDRLKYQGYQGLYITLLKYFKEENIRPMLHHDLLKEFYKPEFYNSTNI